jgi:SAM-dependent methyltransferase
LLGQQGINVTATDASPAMLDIARAKTRHLANITVQPLDLRTPDKAHLPAFDGAFSNFGAFNCLTDWQPVANWLAQRLPSGGRVCLGIMAPFCLWEFAWHGLHLELGVTLRRLRGSTFQPDDSAEAIPVTYPTVRRITRDFAPHFRRTYLQPLGLLVPPSDVYGVIEKRPRLLSLLLAAERRFGKISALALFADHYWIEFERTESQP